MTDARLEFNGSDPRLGEHRLRGTSAVTKSSERRKDFLSDIVKPAWPPSDCPHLQIFTDRQRREDIVRLRDVSKTVRDELFGPPARDLDPTEANAPMRRFQDANDRPN